MFPVKDESPVAVARLPARLLAPALVQAAAMVMEIADIADNLPLLW